MGASTLGLTHGSGRARRLIVDSMEPSVIAACAHRSDDRPRRWFDLMYQLGIDVFGAPPAGRHVLNPLRRDAVLLAWAPSPRVMLACLLGLPVVYLCWGASEPSRIPLAYGLKKLKLETILRGAAVLLANDTVTAAEIEATISRRPELRPFFIDPEFFAFSAPEQRQDFILVPGNADRDEALVRMLAGHGTKIVRVTSSPPVRDFHYRSRNVSVEFSVPFTELRRLYQTASVVALPIKVGAHAAGQTAALEALATGAPVVVTRGRAKAAFTPPMAVADVAEASAEAWALALTEARSMAQRGDSRLRLSAQEVSSRHGFMAVLELLRADVERCLS